MLRNRSCDMQISLFPLLFLSLSCSALSVSRVLFLCLSLFYLVNRSIQLNLSPFLFPSFLLFFSAYLRGPLLVNFFLNTQKLPVALCSCILITKDCQFSRKLTFFFATLLTDAFIFGSLFSSLPLHSCCGMSFLLVVYILKFTCCTFSGCVLNIFPTSCGFFFMFK